MSKKIIVGNTIATPVVSSDWNQADETKVDYIKNKPILGQLSSKDVVSKTDLDADIQASLTKADTAIQSVIGVEGNAVVFGADGAIVDSGIPTHNIHIVRYFEPKNITDEQKAAIARVIQKIVDDEYASIEYAVYIRQGNNLLPAQAVVTGRTLIITAISHDDTTYQYKITATNTSAGISGIKTSKELFFMQDITSNSDSNKAPTAQAVVQYVSDYVEENSNPAVQSDWKQNDETAIDYIKNKPNETDALELVAEMGLIDPITADDGAIYIDENNMIYTL